MPIRHYPTLSCYPCESLPKRSIFATVRKGYLTAEIGDRARFYVAYRGMGFQQVRDILDLEWREIGIPRGAIVIIQQKQKL